MPGLDVNTLRSEYATGKTYHSDVFWELKTHNIDIILWCTLGMIVC